MPIVFVFDMLAFFEKNIFRVHFSLGVVGLFRTKSDKFGGIWKSYFAQHLWDSAEVSMYLYAKITNDKKY